MPSQYPDVGQSLADLRPDIAAQWHPVLNQKTPFEVKVSSGKKAWWQCTLGHSWDAAISSRTQRVQSGCRICANQEVLAGFNDLASKYPALTLQWDYELNAPVTSQRVTSRSMKKSGMDLCLRA